MDPNFDKANWDVQGWKVKLATLQGKPEEVEAKLAEDPEVAKGGAEEGEKDPAAEEKEEAKGGDEGIDA
jgi:hypothetical protein